MFTTTALLATLFFLVSIILVFKLNFIKNQTTFYDRIFLSMLIGVLIFFILLGIKNKVDRESISESQVYHYINVDFKNPFDPEYENFFRVLEVKDGYVLYVDTNLRDTLSCRDNLFLIGKERVK